MVARKLSFIERMTRIRFIPARKLLELYPPFLFMGVKIREASPDHRLMRVYLPLRWYGRNLHGTMFGGFLCSASDPLAALLAARSFKGSEVWTKTHSVEFLRPVHSGVEFRVEITDADVEQIAHALKTHGKCIHEFRFFGTDRDGHRVVKVTNAVYFRAREKRRSNQT